MSDNPFARVKDERRAIRDLALRVRNLERRPQGGGLGGMKWAYQASPTAAVTVGTNSVVGIAPSTAVGFLTNDSSIFAQGNDSYGGAHYGIKIIAETGLYLIIAELQPDSAVPVGVDYSVELWNAGGPDLSQIKMGFGPTRRLALATENYNSQSLTFAMLGTMDSGPNSVPVIFAGVNNNGVHSYDAFLSVLCLQLDPGENRSLG